MCKILMSMWLSKVKFRWKMSTVLLFSLCFIFHGIHKVIRWELSKYEVTKYHHIIVSPCLVVEDYKGQNLPSMAQSAPWIWRGLRPTVDYYRQMKMEMKNIDQIAALESGRTAWFRPKYSQLTHNFGALVQQHKGLINCF